MSSDQLGQYFEGIGNVSPGTAGALRVAADHVAATSSRLLIATVIDSARCPVAVIGADPVRHEDGTTIGRVAADREPVVARTDIVEIWGHGSFPASDPPANW